MEEPDHHRHHRSPAHHVSKKARHVRDGAHRTDDRRRTLLTSAADHLDAPALGGATANGQIAPHSEHGDRDINDVYVFPAPDGGSRTVLAMTVNPAINLFGGNFGTNVRYILNIDRNGDNVQDRAYVVRFGAEDAAGHQNFKITQYTGSGAVSLTRGTPVVHGFSNAKGKVRRRRRPVGLDGRSLGPVLLRPDRLHRDDDAAHDRHGRRG